MSGYAAKRSSTSLLALLPVVIGAVFIAVVISRTAHAQTTVSTVICNEASITVTSPQSDSVVSSPDVTLTGTVVQAGQIEVYIDDTFDSVIPLSVGQTTYQGSVQLTSGTHTIKLIAVDSCESNNATTTTIVTYTPAATGGAGSTTQTGVGDGVTIDANAAPVTSKPSFGLLPAPFRDAIDGLFKWFNIAPNDVSDTGLSRFSMWRAAAITAGAYLAIAGAASWVVTGVSYLPSLFGADQTVRRRMTNRTLRIIGAALILIGFLA